MFVCEVLPLCSNNLLLLLQMLLLLLLLLLSNAVSLSRSHVCLLQTQLALYSLGGCDVVSHKQGQGEELCNRRFEDFV